MAQCSSSDGAAAGGKVPGLSGGSSPPGGAAQQQQAVDQSMKPALFEIFGELWTVEQRLGQGVSAAVYQVSSGRATAAAAAVKEFQADGQGGDYGYQKERAVLEDIQGRTNIGD